MGAGRKTQTFTAPPNQDMATYTASMRNLRKDHLGGVIFGCKDITIKECLSKQLFGLPAAHFQYIRNISPGLPLFLFNYTDRKLHGISEAVGHGQMNINSCGWTTDSSETTPFPAQVQIRGRLQCRPLLESQFKEIIADNYYTENHFWFELDHAQTSKLISKLASGAVASVPQRSKRAPVAASQSTSVPSKLASVQVAPSTFGSQTALDWRSCFPALPSHKTIDEPEWLEPLTSEPDRLSNSSMNLDCPVKVKEAEQAEHEQIYLKLKELAFQYNLSSEGEKMSLSGDVEDSAGLNEMALEDIENPRGPLGLKGKWAESAHSSFEQKSRESPGSLSAQKSGESSLSLSEQHAVIANLIQEVDRLKAFQMEQSEKIGYLEQKMMIEEKSSERPCSLSAQKSGESHRSLCEHESVIAKFTQEVEDLKAFKTEQSKKTGSLERKLMQAEIKIQQLQVWYK